MSRCCAHGVDEHTARGGCMHRKPSGAICPCTFTTGRSQGANPFTTTTKEK